MSRRNRLFWSGFSIPGSAWLAAFYLVPLGFVIAGSLATTDIVGRPVYGWHPGNYEEVFQGVFLPIIERSLLYAAVTVVICLALGYPTAYVISRYGGRWRNVLILGVLVPWLADYLIRIYAWQQLLSEDGPIHGAAHALGLVGSTGGSLLNSGPAVIIGLVYNYLPLMILPIYVAVERFDGRLIEAGKDLYGTDLQVFLRITLPNTWSGVSSGMLLVFLLALGDWATASLLGGPGQYMIGNLIQDQLESAGSLPFGAALTVVLLVVIAAILLLQAIFNLARRRLVAKGTPA